MRAWIDRIVRSVGRLRGHRRLAWALAGLLLLVLCVNGARVVKAEKSGGLFTQYSRSDFDDYFQAARGLRQGADIYRVSTIQDLRAKYTLKDLQRPEVLIEIAMQLRGVGTYLYPPLLAYALGPLSSLSYEWAAALFQIASLLALLGTLVFLARRRVVPVQDLPLLYFLSMLFAFDFLRGNASNGNIGFFLIGLLVVGLAWSFEERPWLAVAGGVLLGLATVLKVTPVFMGLVLLAGWRRWALVGAVLGGLLGLMLPALGLGFGANLELLHKWFEYVIKSFSNMVIVRPWANNQTISAAIGKLLLPDSDNDQALAGLPLLAAPDRALTGKIVAVVRYTNLALYGLAFLASLFVAWRARRGAAAERLQHEGPEGGGALLHLLVALILVSLVGSGVSWYHAYCLLFVPIAWRISAALRGEQLLPVELAFAIVLVIFGVLLPLLPGDVVKVVALWSVFAWLMLGFALAFGWQAVRAVR